MDSDEDGNDSLENASLDPSLDKQKKLEMNRAAAMRSRLKKKREIERLRVVVEELSQAKELVDVKREQYEQLLQISYRDNAIMKAHLVQVEDENAQLRQQITDLERLHP